MSNENAVPSDEWDLATRFHGSEGHQLRAVRQLNVHEQAKAREDAALIHRLTVGSGWNEVNEAAASYDAALEQWSRASTSSSQELRTKLETSAKQLLAALAFYARRAVQLDEIFSVSQRTDHFSKLRSFGWDSLSSQLDNTNWTANALTLIKIIEDVPIAPGRVTATPVLTPLCAEMLSLPNPAETIYSASIILRRFVALAQIAYATLLLDSAEMQEAACLRLKKLTVDILIGEPILMLRQPVPSSESSSNFELKMESLKLELIEPLQSVTLHARTLIENNRQLFDPSSYPPQNPPNIAASLDASVDPAADVPPAEIPEVTTSGGPSDLPAYDLEGLVNSAMSLSEDLEERWSEALSRAIESGDFDQEIAKWSSITKSLISSANQRELLLLSLGIDTVVPKWPLTSDGVAELQIDPPPAVEVMQDSVAHLYVVQQLAECVGSLATPSKTSLDLQTGRWTEWWQAGAFEAVRNAARLALRSVEDLREIETLLEKEETHTEGESAEREAAPRTSRSDANALRRRLMFLEAANLARRAGLPEAMLLYSKLAMGMQAESSEGSASSQMQAAARIEDAVLSRLSGGDTVGLGVVIPAAHLAMERAASSLGLSRSSASPMDGAIVGE